MSLKTAHRCHLQSPLLFSNLYAVHTDNSSEDHPEIEIEVDFVEVLDINQVLIIFNSSAESVEPFHLFS